MWQAAHAVDVTDRAQVAREKLNLEHYDAVVLDVNLPDGSGFDLAADLRAADPGLTDQQAHDRMLAHGSPPVRLLRTLVAA